MILDIVSSFLKKDPTVKRHFVKAISWRLIGSIDTALLGFVITGKLSVGIKIGALELATKIILFFFHERLWMKIPFGLSVTAKQHYGINAQTSNLFRQQTGVAKETRELKNGHKAFTIWLTGLSGSGKSTLANSLDNYFFNQQCQSTVLDGDNTRLGINKDLNFTPEGRRENIRRVAEIAKLFNDSGNIVITAFISPYVEDRQMAKEIIGSDNFVEIYLDATVETCMKRDQKGLYAKAFAGKINNFTGVNSPYEVPTEPMLIVNANTNTIEENKKLIVDCLLNQLYLSPLNK